MQIVKQKQRNLVPSPNLGYAHYNLKDMSGMRFGLLTVIRDSGMRNKSRAVIWECQCDCGQKVLRDGTTLQLGRSRSCGHTRFTEEVIKKRSLKQRKADSPQRLAYRSYYYAARSRGYEFNLTQEEFNRITIEPCFYCGNPPSMEKKSRYSSAIINGIDRKDNSKGYSFGNCVPCCTRCNLMKLYSDSGDFLGHISRIFYHQESKKERKVA